MRRITASFMRRPKKPMAALLASLVLPGAGQIYNREILKGLLLFLIAVGFIMWTVSNVVSHRAVYQQFLDQTALSDIATAQADARMPYPCAPLLFYALVALYSALDSFWVARQIVTLLGGDRTTIPPTSLSKVSAEQEGGASCDRG